MITINLLSGGRSLFRVFVLFLLLEFLGMFLVFVADLYDLTNVGHRKIREDDCLEKAVGEIEPKTKKSRNDDRTYYREEFHEYERAENVTEEPQCQRHGLRDEIEELEGQHYLERRRERYPEALQTDELDRDDDYIDDREDRTGDRERNVLGRRCEFQEGNAVASRDHDTEGHDHGGDFLCFLPRHAAAHGRIDDEVNDHPEEGLLGIGTYSILADHEAEDYHSGNNSDPCDNDRVSQKDLIIPDIKIVLDLKDPFAYLRADIAGLKSLDKLGAECLPEFRKPGSGR